MPFLRPCPLLVVALASVTSARADMEFVGVLAMPGRTLFALSDETSKPAVWRTLGQEFDGCTLAEFDAKNELLTLTKAGASHRLHLKDDAKVKASRLELTGTIKAGVGEKIEVTRVTLAFDQETALPLKDGFTWHITPTLLPDGNIRYAFSVDRTRQEGEINRIYRLSAPSVITRPQGSFKFAVDDLQFEFAPANP